jgi:multiple sugar transport system substrate-binding protein
LICSKENTVNSELPLSGVSRRSVLLSGGALAAAAGLGLAGCSKPQAGGTSKLTIPSQGASLPKGNATFRCLGPQGLQGTFWKSFFVPAWRNTHPNITFRYEALPTKRVAEVVPLGIRNGSVHDVFILPNTISTAQAVAEGWVRPLDDIIPKFEEWKAGFPEGLFIEGLNVFDGKAYTLPIVSAKHDGTALYFNSKLMEAAGYDPSKQLSYEDYRAAARKVTEQGKGRAYGITMGAEPRILNRQTCDIVTVAGQPMDEDGMDARTGKFVFTSDRVLEVVELYAAIKSDGSFFPGMVSLTQQEAYGSFPQGNAGMIFTGEWVVPEWDKANFEYGVGPKPVPGGRDPYPLGSPPVGGPSPFVYDKTPHPEIAGEVMSYLGTPEGVRYWAAFTALGQGPTRPHISCDEDDPEVKRAIELAAKAGVDQGSKGIEAAKKVASTMRVAPQPAIRNPEIAKVKAALKAPTPDFGEIIQAMLVGKVDNIKGALRDLQDRSDKALDEAIAKVNKRGGKVSRDDYAFPNYDPKTDYGPEDYAAL